MPGELYDFMEKDAGLASRGANWLRTVVPDAMNKARTALQGTHEVASFGALPHAPPAAAAGGILAPVSTALHAPPMHGGVPAASHDAVRNMLPTGASPHAPAAAPAGGAAPAQAAPPTAAGAQAQTANAHGASAANGWEHAQHGKPVAPPQYDAATGAYTAYYPNKDDPRSAIKATYHGHEAPAPSGPNTPYEHLAHGAQGLAQQGLQSARRAAPWAAGTAAVGAGGYALSRAGHSADEQEARMRDYYANAAHQMPQPVPGMGVYASYDEFANEKIASLTKAADGPPPRYDTLGQAHNAFAGAFGNALATKFVSDPIDGIHRILKKKIVDDPKAHATFHGVIESDPDLQKHYAQNPGQVDDTFKALRKFGPSMATSPAVVRSFLRQSMMTGGNMDFATIRMLAETEKFIQNGRGQGK